MIISIYVFYAFMFAPKVIDKKSSFFWRWNVDLLNSRRNGTFYLWKFKIFYLRDPHCCLSKSEWVSFKFLPICWSVK